MHDLTAKQWRDDLNALEASLRREHRNLFHTVSPDAFDRVVRALHGRIPWLPGHEIVVEMARIVTLVGDGHTVLRLTETPGFRRYPIEIERFSDGLFVRTIGPGNEAVGARVIAIGETPAEEAYALMRPIVSRDNEMGMAATAPALLAIPEILHARRLVPDMESATYTVQLTDGALMTLTIQPAPALPDGLVDMRAGSGSEAPLWLRNRAANWYEHLPEDGALYVAFNQVRDSDDQPLVAFFEEIFTVIEQQQIDRLILDIRRNSGGNNLLNRPLVHHLIRCDRVNRWGGLFAIIGRHTFSAAMNLAVDLERHTRVLFAGEPTGSSPNHYGEVGQITLPHSGLSISVSTLWWQMSDPIDDRPWIVPDLPARLSSGDYAHNHDPSLDAALRHKVDASAPLEYPDRLFAQLRRDDLRLEY